MFIGHIPGAYLAFKAFASKPTPKYVLVAGMVGAVTPDFDLAWFYLIDNRAHHHHDYITHRPFLWITLFAMFWLWFRASKRCIATVGMAASAGAITHMILDSIVGKIAWLWPFNDIAIPLVSVPETHDHWIKSFLHHWTFRVEIALTLLALAVLVRSILLAHKNKKPDHL